jgi:hypothetical protein
MAALTVQIYETMTKRNEQLKLHRIEREQLTPILFVVDELHVWLSMVDGIKHGRVTIAELWRALLMMGRVPRIHNLVGIQRPDAKVFGGAARDQLEAVLCVGKAKRGIADMMFQDTSIGRDIPKVLDGRPLKGRATADMGDGPTECQVFWTPPPWKGQQSPEDEQISSALRLAADAKHK